MEGCYRLGYADVAGWVVHSASRTAKVRSMITGIRVPAGKILKNVNVSIGERFTVIVGPNSSGKSTLLLAILASTSFTKELDEFEVEIDYVNEAMFGGLVEIVQIGRNRHRVTVGPKGVQVNVGFDLWPSVAKHLDTRLLKLNSEVASRTSYVDTKAPRLGNDGMGLASVIGWYLKTGRIDAVEDVTESLQKLVPLVRRIWVDNAKFERTETEIVSVGGTEYPITRSKSYWGDLLMFDTVGKSGIPATEMSEGTILATALLTLLHGENPPNLLLMDDIDKDLHPRAIASLVEILKGIMEQRPELQIIATTHSPYLLDQIPVEAVICMHVADDGYARAKPLTDHPEYPRWKGVMTAGEFWGTMGDEWVTRDEKAVAQ